MFHDNDLEQRKRSARIEMLWLSTLIEMHGKA